MDQWPRRQYPLEFIGQRVMDSYSHFRVSYAGVYRKPMMVNTSFLWHSALLFLEFPIVLQFKPYDL